MPRVCVTSAPHRGAGCPLMGVMPVPCPSCDMVALGAWWDAMMIEGDLVGEEGVTSLGTLESHPGGQSPALPPTAVPSAPLGDGHEGS